MQADFDIIEYISGLTGFVFDKAVLNRIALDRCVSEIDDYEDLTQRQKDLLRADLLYTAYCSPTVIANHSISHGSFSRSVGSQTVNREDMYQIFMGIYRKYNDDKLAEAEESSLQWIDEVY